MHRSSAVVARSPGSIYNTSTGVHSVFMELALDESLRVRRIAPYHDSTAHDDELQLGEAVTFLSRWTTRFGRLLAGSRDSIIVE